MWASAVRGDDVTVSFNNVSCGEKNKSQIFFYSVGLYFSFIEGKGVANIAFLRLNFYIALYSLSAQTRAPLSPTSSLSTANSGIDLIRLLRRPLSKYAFMKGVSSP